MSKDTQEYRVSCTVIVNARNQRHAAHIAKALMGMNADAGGAEEFIVEERVGYGRYIVNIKDAQETKIGIGGTI